VGYSLWYGVGDEVVGFGVESCVFEVRLLVVVSERVRQVIRLKWGARVEAVAEGAGATRRPLRLAFTDIYVSSFTYAVRFGHRGAFYLLVILPCCYDYNPSHADTQVRACRDHVRNLV
jgi:hypothetical protein